MKRAKHLIGVLAVALTASACQSTFSTTTKFDRGAADPRVLLMPPEVLLGEVTSGGVVEPNAEWTSEAQGHIEYALGKFLASRKLRLIRYKAPDAVPERSEFHTQLVKLHGAVGRSIIEHQLGPTVRLPTKKGKFDWTLGSGVRRLQEEYGADYALFVSLQDTYTSGGRAVALVMASVLYRWPLFMGAGRQIGFASLGDLKSGAVVWFNRVSRSEGDLREAAPARESIETLMREFPT